MKFNTKAVLAATCSFCMLCTQTPVMAQETTQKKLTVYYVYETDDQNEYKKAGTLKFTSPDTDKEVSYLAVEDLQTWVMENRPDKGYDADLSSIQFEENGAELELKPEDKTIEIADGTKALYIEADQDDDSQYDVYFYTQPGDLYKEAEDQTKLVYPETDPQQKGYTFDGWNMKEDTKLDGTTYVYASWTKTTAQYTVTYTYLDEDGKETTTTKTVDENEATPEITLPTVEGKKFVEWQPALADNVTKDADYTAIYEDVTPAQYTITFHYLDADGAETSETTSVKEGEPTTAPELPEVEGRKFTGWTPALAETVTADADYTAQYEDVKPQTYTVTYNYVDADGNKQSKEFTVNEGEATPEFTAPRREGYTFKGWDPEVADTVTENVKYTAQYEAEAPKTYTVTYKYLDADGKEQTKAFTVKEGDPTPEFTAPERKGFKFEGWEPALAQTVTADAAYTAKWTEEKAAEVIDIKVTYLEEGTRKELHYPNVLKVKKGEPYDASSWDQMKIQGYTYVKTEGAVKGTAEKNEDIIVWYRSDKTPAKGADGTKTSTQTNTGLYVGLGVVAAAIIVILVAMSRKKK